MPVHKVNVSYMPPCLLICYVCKDWIKIALKTCQWAVAQNIWQVILHKNQVKCSNITIISLKQGLVNST